MASKGLMRYITEVFFASSPRVNTSKSSKPFRFLNSQYSLFADSMTRKGTLCSHFGSAHNVFNKDFDVLVFPPPVIPIINACLVKSFLLKRYGLRTSKEPFLPAAHISPKHIGSSMSEDCLAATSNSTYSSI